MKRTTSPTPQPDSPLRTRHLVAIGALSTFVLGGALVHSALATYAQSGAAIDDAFADLGVAKSLSNDFWADPLGFAFGEDTSGTFWTDPLGYIFGTGTTQDLPAEVAAEELLAAAANTFAGQVDGLDRYNLTVRELLDAYDRLRAAPDYDYVTGISYNYRGMSDDPLECPVTGFALEYLIDEPDRASYADDLSAAVTEVVAQVEGSGAQSDYEKARAAYDALLQRSLGVSGSTSVSFTAYGCLVRGSAVGRGFADAYYLVMRQLGIPCTVVFEEGGSTAWNQVQIDGVWYNANLYWDSRLNEGDPATHLFFLCSDDAMRKGGVGSWEGEVVDAGYGETGEGASPEQRLSTAADVWRNMLGQGLEQSSEVEAYHLTYGEVVKAFDLYIADDPYYDYVSRHGASYRFALEADGSDGLVTSLSASYRLAPEYLPGYDEAMRAGLEGLLSCVDRESSTYYQVLAVHDWIVSHVFYDESLAEPSHTAYSALVLGTAVCQGYSDLFQLAMDALGIPCERVVSLDMGHQWNMVCIDDQWYHIDVTWDDSVAGIGSWGDSTYTYFLRSDESMAQMEHCGWTAFHEAPYDYYW